MLDLLYIRYIWNSPTTTIPSSDNFKVFDVTLDSSLKYDAHI